MIIHELQIVIDTLPNQQVFFYPHLHPFVMTLALIIKKLKRIESKERKKERKKERRRKRKRLVTKNCHSLLASHVSNLILYTRKSTTCN
jgi:hypothetical protein